MTVAIVQQKEHENPIKKSIEMCDGFKKLKPDDKILIKPNLVVGGRKGFLPPFGKVTTAAVIRQLIECLKGAGCNNISIGEGSPVLKEIDCDTMSAFHYAGMDNVAKEYGVNLIDFEQMPYESIKIDDHNFKISKSALEADFLINVPVLKTHGQTIVSLGMKNLKGCLKFSSKKRFHKTNILYRLIAHLNTVIRSDLTIIDGTFGLDHGPSLGDAHPMGLIITGTDIFETELIGAALLGKNPQDIKHITEFAELMDRDINTKIEVSGCKVADFVMDLPYEQDFNRAFSKYNITGIHVNHAPDDSTICSNCMANIEFPNGMFAKDNAGRHFGGMDICLGMNSKADPSSNHTVLFGDCAIKNNQDVKNATLIRGCPPDMGEYYKFLVKSNLSKGIAIPQMMLRLLKMTGFKFGIYKENFGFWDNYQTEEFDLKLYE